MPLQDSKRNYELLIDRLDQFVRKYYLNQIIRGALFSVGGILAIYLLISLLEYQAYLDPSVKTPVFWGAVIASLGMLVSWIGIPAFRYFKLGKTISHEQAAQIIGNHFSEIQDKLLNVLQLQQQSQQDSAAAALIEASIDQKIEEIKPVPFRLAIDLSKNKKYLSYALPPLAVLVIILFARPSILSDSNERLINYNKVFEKEAPFEFLLNDSDPLQVVQYDDYTLKVKVDGDALPEQASILIDGSAYRLEKTSPDEFSYTFRQVDRSREFFLEAEGFRSSDFELEMIPKPALINFDLVLDYPDYTGLKDEILKNTGDAQVPEGSELRWIFRTDHTSRIDLKFPEALESAQRTGESEFQFEKRISESASYKIGMANEKLEAQDSIAFRIQAIADQFPQIAVERFEDSTNNKYLYFLGQGSDDYGIRNIDFVWTWEGKDAFGSKVDKGENRERIIMGAGRQSSFTWNWDLTKINLEPGDRINYYFELWDNDGVNGSKSARTASMQFELPTLKEVEEQTEQNNQAIKEQLSSALDDIQEIQEEIDELRDELVQKKELDWEDREQIEKMLEKQKQVSQNVEQLKELFQENIEQQQEFRQFDEEIINKQQRLQEMFEEVLDEEMKKMFEELEELLEELNKEQSLEELEDLEMTDEQLEQELDRMLELFKEYEMQQKMQEVIDELEELAEEQEELAEQSGDKKADEEELAKQQEALNEKFEDIREDIEQIEQLIEELSDPKQMDDTEQQEQDIQESMEQSSEQLQQGKQKQAQQQQQQSSDQMEQLSQQMQSSLSNMQQQQQGEDMEALRQLLDNLIKLSFDQEQVMNELNEMRSQNPAYVSLVQEQFRISEDIEMVKDSLQALAKRVVEISTFVTREITEVDRHMEKSLEQLSERRIPRAQEEQQYVMTGMNNLALMLDEVLQQMQQSMASMMQGSQNCQKPGQGQPSPSDQLGKQGDLQQQLNQQLQEMQQGNGPNGRNPLTSKQYAQMAARQAAIRQAMEEMSQQMHGSSENGDIAKELKEIADAMEGTEEDLVNKIFDNELLERQQEIMTRLLEAEDALREREIDPKRESETASEISREIPPALEEYLKKRQAELDLWKTVPPDLKPYYRNLVEQYLRELAPQ